MDRTRTLIRRLLRNLARDESGQDMIEYALVATIIAMSLISIMRAYETDVKGLINGLGLSLTNAI